MEQQILNAVRDAISKSIITALSGYHSPLTTMVNNAVGKHTATIEQMIDDEFSQLLGGDGFRLELRTALNQKIAKLLVSKTGGELEKRVNELKQNPQTRAKITLAINEIIETL